MTTVPDDAVWAYTGELKWVKVQPTRAAPYWRSDRGHVKGEWSFKQFCESTEVQFQNGKGEWL